MARYILHIGGNPFVERAIDAGSDAEVFGFALTALDAFLRSNFPPSVDIRMTVMDASKNRIGVLTLCQDLAGDFKAHVLRLAV